MATKTNTSTRSIDTLKVDFGTNVRLQQNYDIPSMKQAIMDVGRITDPIHIRADGTVLRGNRRTLAGQELLADPSCPQDLAAALKKVSVVVHDVVPGSQEELAIVLDHGSQKGLNKTEVLLAVWRLDKQFLSESQIINAMYFALAEYTRNPKKAQEAAAIANLRDRQEYLRKWLHGTVGNYILAANKMGDYVRNEMLKTHLADDNLLPAGDKLECRMSRDRITQLSAAKSKDADTKAGGEGWSPEQGGKNFNETLEKFKAEDRGESTEDKSKRPTVKELTERADAFKSPAIRSALLVAAGQSQHGKDLVELDDRLHRLNLVCETLSKRIGEIQDPNVANLVKAIIGNGPAGEVELALNKLVGK